MNFEQYTPDKTRTRKSGELAPKYGGSGRFNMSESSRQGISHGMRSSEVRNRRNSREAGSTKMGKIFAVAAVAVLGTIGVAYGKKGVEAVANSLPKPEPMYTDKEVAEMQKVEVEVAYGTGANQWIIDSGQGELLDGEHEGQRYFLTQELTEEVRHPGEELQVPVMPGQEKNVAEYLKQQG